MADLNIAQRLRQARESVGLTVVDASAKVGFTHYQTLSQIESGAREVKASELVNFSKSYYCSIQSLLGQQDEINDSHLLWREGPSDEQRKSIEKKVHSLAEECNWLLNVLGYKQNSEFKLLDISVEDIGDNRKIDRLAKKVSQLLDLGKRPALVLKDVLEQEFSVKIFYEPLSDIGSAASMIHSVYGAVIVINSDEAPWRRNFDLAHELFHLITWKAFTYEELTSNTTLFNDIEGKADRFASTLLLPDEEVLNELHKRVDSSNGKITKGDFVDIAREFGVSAPALAFRLVRLKSIKWELATKINSDEEIRNINKAMRWEELCKAPTSELLINLAIVALRKAHISRGKFTELTGVDRCDINDFIAEKGKLNSDGEKFEIMAA